MELGKFKGDVKIKFIASRKPQELSPGKQPRERLVVSGDKLSKKNVLNVHNR